MLHYYWPKIVFIGFFENEHTTLETIIPTKMREILQLCIPKILKVFAQKKKQEKDIPTSLFFSCLDYVPLLNITHRSFHFVAKLTFGDVETANMSLLVYEIQFGNIFDTKPKL